MTVLGSQPMTMHEWGRYVGWALHYTLRPRLAWHRRLSWLQRLQLGISAAGARTVLEREPEYLSWLREKAWLYELLRGQQKRR